jgi:hypothetical protein
MCKVKTATYTPAPERASTRTPDNRGLYDMAREQAAQRGGGRQRSTVLGGLQTTMNPAMTTSRTLPRPTTTLG